MRRDKDPELGISASHDSGAMSDGKVSTVLKTGQNRPGIGYTRDEPSVNTNQD